jgi:predicted short-subunit dehydrogenase-like oxidoreductase (DUF2520 family)
MKTVFIGAGNLATHLAIAFKNNGIEIIQVFSRTETSAKQLADQIGCNFCTETNQILADAELYVYAIKDSELERITSLTGHFNGIHVHTAGSVDINIFENKAKKYGVFYPLQTFSKKKSLNFSQIPIFIEASTPEVEQQLITIAKNISQKTYSINSLQRAQLHLSAVFACNFSNLMYSIAADVVEDAKLPFDVLQPLITETADKINFLTPRQAQTGPAVRYDNVIIQKHIKMLSDKHEMADLYEKLSNIIFDQSKN